MKTVVAALAVAVTAAFSAGPAALATQGAPEQDKDTTTRRNSFLPPGSGRTPVPGDGDTIEQARAAENIVKAFVSQDPLRIESVAKGYTVPGSDAYNYVQHQAHEARSHEDAAITLLQYYHDYPGGAAICFTDQPDVDDTCVSFTRFAMDGRQATTFDVCGMSIDGSARLSSGESDVDDGLTVRYLSSFSRLSGDGMYLSVELRNDRSTPIRTPRFTYHQSGATITPEPASVIAPNEVGPGDTVAVTIPLDQATRGGDLRAHAYGIDIKVPIPDE